jgi:hypothetical protein
VPRHCWRWHQPLRPQAAAQGRHTTIGAPGAVFTVAVDASVFGVPAGLYTGSSGATRGFTGRDGSITTLNVPGAAGTVAAGINDWG